MISWAKRVLGETAAVLAAMAGAALLTFALLYALYALPSDAARLWQSWQG